MLLNKSLALISAGLLLGFHSYARTLKVGPSQQLHTVGSAISACRDGDTIYVGKGIYKEKNIVIKKSIALIGIGYPVLDGEHKYQIISIEANSVTVKGFRFLHTGVSSMEDIAAIKLYSSHNAIICGNNFEDTFFGIYSQGGVNCLIADNKLTGNGKTEQESGNGIHCWKSDSMQIVGNVITGHRDGIYFEFVTSSVIRNNVSYSNMRYGLHFMFSNNDSYFYNTFRNNGAGVSVMFTHGVKMCNNTFEENWGDGSYGIFLKEITDSYISGNKFVRNTTGIYFEGTSRIIVTKNIFINNGWALKIESSCADNAISNNNFFSNTFDVGTNGTLVLNTFDHNYWDKYEGYDLNKDKIGDVPYRPVSLYSMIVEKEPSAMVLFRSFITTLLDESEKVLPTLIPEHLKDNCPLMKPVKL